MFQLTDVEVENLRLQFVTRQTSSSPNVSGAPEVLCSFFKNLVNSSSSKQIALRQIVSFYFYKSQPFKKIFSLSGGTGSLPKRSTAPWGLKISNCLSGRG